MLWLLIRSFERVGLRVSLNVNTAPFIKKVPHTAERRGRKERTDNKHTHKKMLFLREQTKFRSELKPESKNQSACRTLMFWCLQWTVKQRGLMSICAATTGSSYSLMTCVLRISVDHHFQTVLTCLVCIACPYYTARHCSPSHTVADRQPCCRITAWAQPLYDATSHLRQVCVCVCERERQRMFISVLSYWTK